MHENELAPKVENETIEVDTNVHFKEASELNSKQEIIEELAVRIFGTPELLDGAITYAEKHKKSMESMEDYATKFFGFLINKFEDLRLRQVALSKAQHRKLKRTRRK